MSAGSGRCAEEPLIITALFEHLPPPGADFPLEQRLAWLQAAAAIFRLIFEGEGRVLVSIAQSPGPAQ